MTDQNPTIAEYVVDRLAHLGIEHVFGVPGDYAFPWNDAIEAHPALRWVGSANELNAAYAADGYARIRGASMLCTTYGVGELSALNGLMGAYAERVPIFHIAGAPSSRLRRAGRVAHHIFPDADYSRNARASSVATCAQAELTPDNAIDEMERLIKAALVHRRPIYIACPQDYLTQPVIGRPVRSDMPFLALQQPPSDAVALEESVAAILSRLSAASSAVVLASQLVARLGLQQQLLRLLGASGMPFATSPMDKGVLSEQHPQFLGMYSGAMSAPGVATAVEGADVVIDLGVVRSDLNTGIWSDAIDMERLITVDIDSVGIAGEFIAPVTMSDVLGRLADGTPRFAGPGPAEAALPERGGEGTERIASATFYPTLQRYLRPGNVVISDAGTCMLPMSNLRLPEGVTFLNQLLWGSIGWGTPVAFGAALADPARRVLLVTGDGAHQLTANELGAMGRYGATPILMVLNNGMFGIEEVLSATPRLGHDYDYLAAWNYHQVPPAMGCKDWFCVRVETLAELDAALGRAVAHESASLIEVVTGTEDVGPRMPTQALDRLYGVDEPE